MDIKETAKVTLIFKNGGLSMETSDITTSQLAEVLSIGLVSTVRDATMQDRGISEIKTKEDIINFSERLKVLCTAVSASICSEGAVAVIAAAKGSKAGEHISSLVNTADKEFMGNNLLGRSWLVLTRSIECALETFNGLKIDAGSLQGDVENFLKEQEK